VVVEHVITRYFSQPNYWRIDGRPYFSVYDLPQLIAGLGSIEQTAQALRHFRERTRAAGQSDLHLNLVLWQHGILQGEKPIPVDLAMVKHLGFDSITSYVWVHHVKMETFPGSPYLSALPPMLAYGDKTAAAFAPLPYYPNATMGWDSTPRTLQTDRFANAGYPFTASYTGNTPENFKTALKAMRQWLETRPAPERIMTINAWNEWTEGSYLEPDTKSGYGYLEAIREVFGPVGKP
jgi:hypothetical protein